MSYRLQSIFMLLALIFLSSCFGGNGNNSQAGNNQDNKEKTSQDRGASSNENSLSSDDTKSSDNVNQNNEYKLSTNRRFNFRIAIPKEWEIKKRSSNEDGFFLKTASEETDLRVYGERLTKETRDLTRPDCKEESKFSFQDGETGTKCLKSKKLIYYRENDSKRVTFYIKARKKWRQNHADQLSKIAKSLVFIEQERPS